MNVRYHLNETGLMRLTLHSTDPEEREEVEVLAKLEDFIRLADTASARWGSDSWSIDKVIQAIAETSID